MTSLYWIYVFLILHGTMDDALAVTCTQDYLQKATQCLTPFNEAVMTIATTSEFSSSVTTKLLFMKVFCARPEFTQALICVTNAIKVCGTAFDVDRWVYSMLSEYDESRGNQMCGYLPVLEENLACLNSLDNSTTLALCTKPTEYDMQVSSEISCRSTFASAVCALTEVEVRCPAAFSAYKNALQVAPSRYCRIDLCTLEYGNCGGKFERNMPQNAIPARPGDLVAYAYAIQYVCGLGKSYLECMMNGDHCKGFRYMMTIPQMFGIDFEPIRYLVKYGCKDIDILSSNISCMIDQIHTPAFRQCYLQMLYTAGSVPEKPYEIVSCEIYEGTSVCLNKVVPVPCGQEIADYFVRWSPAMFRLDKGCGSWMVSSASSIEKITTLILIQLSIALKFLLKD